MNGAVKVHLSRQRWGYVTGEFSSAALQAQVNDAIRRLGGTPDLMFFQSLEDCRDGLDLTNRQASRLDREGEVTVLLDWEIALVWVASAVELDSEELRDAVLAD